ncbi:MAG: hypothetical protein E7257_10165 [Lachnospiraceae bacterium]|nr:hypothetical protein [Lachnospiraceae bacterium]
MSFYVDYNEFRNFKYSVVSQLVSIAQNLENVDVTLSSMIANPAMHGEGAESIYSYLYDMISNTIPIISTIVVDFSSKLSLLEAGLYELEPATYGVLPEEEISATVNAYKMASYDIRVLSEEVNGVINDVSGICEFEKPSVSKLSEHMGAVITRGTVLKQCIEALDESHYNTELAQLEELLDSAIELIDTLNNQSWNVTSYQLGAFCSLPEYTAIADELVDTINYHESNQEELALAEQLCTAKLEDVMADERISEGLNKIFFGADSSSLGFGTLWLARLVAVPWYIKLPAFGIAVLGGFEAVEGAQDVIYGTQGDIHTDSTNALKDLLGEDNYYKAIEYGTLVTGGYMAGKTVYEIAKLKLTGSSAWFGTGVTSDVVPVGAIDDVVPVGTVDDLVLPGNADELIEGGSNPSTKPYTNSRPSFRKGVVEEVWENAKGPDGLVRDPNTGEVINWTPGESRKGVWDMGHIPEAKYSDVHDLYMNGELTTKEFVDWYNDPDNYRPELPSNNRSHKYE